MKDNTQAFDGVEESQQMATIPFHRTVPCRTDKILRKVGIGIVFHPASRVGQFLGVVKQSLQLRGYYVILVKAT